MIFLSWMNTKLEIIDQIFFTRSST